MPGQRDLIKGRRDRLMKRVTPPTRFYRDDGGDDREMLRERMGVGGGGGEGMDWSDREFSEIRTRLAGLEEARQRMLSGDPPDARCSPDLEEERTSFLIYFDSGEDKVRGQRGVIDRAARTILMLKDGSVTVTGHTDRHMTYRESLDLGAVRAIAVKKQLLLRDVPEDRIECHSAGFSQPRRSCDPLAEEADIMNRRVEIHITKG